MNLKKLTIVIVLSMAVAISPLTPMLAQTTSDIRGTGASQLITETNKNRNNNSASTLATNSQLMKAAQLKAENMAEENYFAHTSPKGVSPWKWFSDAGYKPKLAGENLALTYSLESDIVDAWMESPGHKKNLLNKNYKDIGIGIAKGKHDNQDVYYIVQLFGTAK